MNDNLLNVGSDKLIDSAIQTIYMLGWALFFGTIIGIPLALI